MTTQPPTAINTRSGKILDFADPDPTSICIEDIAGGLALAPRFGGQALHFHSVAQHAVNVALVVEAIGHPELGLVALHHDSHEAYACDLPRPLKKLLGDSYKNVTDRLDLAIGAALGFEWPEPGSAEALIIKQADDVIFIIEADRLLVGDPVIPTVNREVLAAARELLAAEEQWERREAEAGFTTMHGGCLRHR